MLRLSLKTPYVRPTSLFMLRRIQVLHSPKHITLDGKICRNTFWMTYNYDIYQAHIYQKPSITVEHFSVSYCCNIAHVQTTHLSRSCSGMMDLRKLDVFVETYKNDVTFQLSWIYNCLSTIYKYIATGVYNKTQTLCILFERHTCSICT